MFHAAVAVFATPLRHSLMLPVTLPARFHTESQPLIASHPKLGFA